MAVQDGETVSNENAPGDCECQMTARASCCHTSDMRLLPLMEATSRLPLCDDIKSPVYDDMWMRMIMISGFPIPGQAVDFLI